MIVDNKVSIVFMGAWLMGPWNIIHKWYNFVLFNIVWYLNNNE